MRGRVKTLTVKSSSQYIDTYKRLPLPQFIAILGLAPRNQVTDLSLSPTVTSSTLDDAVASKTLDELNNNIVDYLLNQLHQGSTPTHLELWKSDDTSGDTSDQISDDNWCHRNVSIRSRLCAVKANLDEDSTSVQSEDEDTSEKQDKMSKSWAFLKIDLTSPLGSRILKHVEKRMERDDDEDDDDDDDENPDERQFEHYCQTRQQHKAQDGVSKSNSPFPITYRPRRRTLHDVHWYKFNKNHKNEFKIRLRTGLNKRSRTLKKKMNHSRISIKKLTKQEIEYFSKAKDNAAEVSTYKKSYLGSSDQSLLLRHLLPRTKSALSSQSDSQDILKKFQIPITPPRSRNNSVSENSDADAASYISSKINVFAQAASYLKDLPDDSLNSNAVKTEPDLSDTATVYDQATSYLQHSSRSASTLTQIQNAHSDPKVLMWDICNNEVSKGTTTGLLHGKSRLKSIPRKNKIDLPMYTSKLSEFMAQKQRAQSYRQQNSSMIRLKQNSSDVVSVASSEGSTVVNIDEEENISDDDDEIVFNFKNQNKVDFTRDLPSDFDRIDSCIDSPETTGIMFKCNLCDAEIMFTESTTRFIREHFATHHNVFNIDILQHRDQNDQLVFSIVENQAPSIKVEQNTSSLAPNSSKTLPML